MRSSGFAFEDMMRGPFGNFTDHVGGEMIDLNLGNWACLENTWSGGTEKSPSSVFSTLSTATVTKRKNPPPLGDSPFQRCQVEGCNLDLSCAKDYHRRNRVCDYHSKSSLVIVEGLERRFCQQCSRFHGLSEFDQLKRSCRKRLSAHNARRRKPQQERIALNSPRLTSSSFYDGRKQMNFLLNTRAQARNAASSDWESTYDSKFTITKGQPQVTGNQLPYAISMHGNPSNGFSGPKGIAASRVLSPQRFKDATTATVDELPDFHRAFSLLSTNSWGSCEPVSIPFENMHGSRMNMSQTPIHAVPLSSFPSSEYWQDGQSSTYPRVHTLTSSSRGIGLNEGFQLPNMSYGTEFYFRPLHY